MKVYVHVILQAAAFVAQWANLASTVTPVAYKPFIMLALSASQGLIAWYAHNYAAGQVKALKMKMNMISKGPGGPVSQSPVTSL
jgi:hypothetical protein